MNFGRITTSACVDTVVPDDRCKDEAWALANPTICPPAPKLILKPGVALVCTFRSIHLRACFYDNGIETDVTNHSVFSTGDENIVTISALTGSLTGRVPGTTIVTARYGGFTATSEITVLTDYAGGCDCCDPVKVTTIVLVDHTRSMSQRWADPPAAGSYGTKLDFAKAAAEQYISETRQISEVKDRIGLLEFTDASNEILSVPTSDIAGVEALVGTIDQTQQLTSFYDALKAAIEELDAKTQTDVPEPAFINRRVLYIISDGEDSDTSYTETDNPIALLNNFKASGGIVMVLGVRAHDRGYALLARFASGGFFVNGYDGADAEALATISGLKGYLCAGNCNPVGDEYVGQGALNYIDYINWDVTGGYTDLQGNGFFDYLPGTPEKPNGLYVDLVSGDQPLGDANPVMTTKDAYPIEPGKTYRLRLSLAGNQVFKGNTGVVRVRIFSNLQTALDQTVVITDYRQDFRDYSFSFTAAFYDNVHISIQQVQGQGLPDPSAAKEKAGVLMNEVIFENVTDGFVGVNAPLFDNFDDENLTYVPPRCGFGTTYHYGDDVFVMENVIPVMTSDTDPSGEASASIEDFGTFAFQSMDDDRDYGGTGLVTDAASGRTQWLQYKFVVPTPIASYSSGVFFTLGDCDITLSGSNDGATWDLLDSWTSTGGGQFMDRTLADQVTYKYYRLGFHKSVVGPFSGYYVPDFQLIGPVPVFGYGYSYGYCCYGEGCLDDPPACQEQDPHPLGDLEAGFEPPKQFVSTKTVCVTCADICPECAPFDQTNLVPHMTSNTTPSGVASADDELGNEAYLAFDRSGGSGFSSSWQTGDEPTELIPHWLRYQFTAATAVGGYAVTCVENLSAPRDWKLQGSANGTAWTDLDEQQDISWYNFERKLFQTANTTAYVYYRILITESGGGSLSVQELELFPPVTAAISTICRTATVVVEGGTQTAADEQAKDAARALALQAISSYCLHRYSATESYEAHSSEACDANCLDDPHTAAATRTSFNSMKEAEDAALAAAKAEALAAVDCTKSNNTAKITIPGSGTEGPASPYPSVKYVSTSGVITTVTVTIKKFKHTYPREVSVVLVSPSGRKVVLMTYTMHIDGGNDTVGHDITFDDAAADYLPASGPPVSFALPFKPTQYGGAPTNPFMPDPCPDGPFAIVLSEFTGDEQHGCWALYVEDDLGLDTGEILGWEVTIT